MAEKREHFSSRFGFVAALAGSAIGPGNIWRFPYMVGEHGGASFILVYILCSLFISLPILFVEQIIGRRAGQSTYGAMQKLSRGASWKYVGLLAVAACFIILSYYSVVGGWSMDYLVRSILRGFDYSSVESSASIFSRISTSTYEPLLYFVLFLVATAAVVIGGIKQGIEKFSKFSIPLLFIIIVLLALFSISLPGAKEGVTYLIKPDFSKLTFSTFSYALGQSFFSMSLGVGCVLTYSSYMRKKENLATTGILTSVFDTVFAIIAGFAIMPAVFAAGLEPGAGPSLIYETIPYIFSQLNQYSPFLSRVVSILFFLTILMAALTSSISLYEVCVSYLIDRNKMLRKKAIIYVFIGALVLGTLCSMSFGCLSGVQIFGLNIFSFLDTFTSNYLMLFGAFAFAVFVGWKMGREEVRDEFTNSGTVNVKLFDSVFFVIKWIIPLVIVLIFLTNINF